MTFEQRLEGGERGSHEDNWERAFWEWEQPVQRS